MRSKKIFRSKKSNYWKYKFDSIVNKIWQVWHVPDNHPFTIKNYSFLYKVQKNGRGGDVPLYIKEGVTFKLLDMLSIFEESVSNVQIFANHAESLSNQNLPTYILSDSNIDLLKMSHKENK